jgi:predicted phosphodiesterase
MNRRQAVQEVIEANPDASKRRMAMILASRYPDLFADVETARSSIRYYTDQNGEKLRKYSKNKLPDPKGKGSKVYALPASQAKPWEPYELKASCVAIFGDTHFPKHDVQAIEAAVAHVKAEFEPDAILLNGDFADAEEFSSWAKSPRGVGIENTLEIVRQGLLYFRTQFPNAKLIYKLGNHEERLEKYCWSRAPELVGLDHISWQGLLTIDKDLNKVDELRDVVFVGEQRPIQCGKLPIFHGHELPKGLTNSVNPARGAFLRMIETCAINHHHRSSSHVEYTWRHEPINCWSIGCLCHLNMEYARINKWNHGHAVVEVAKNKNFNLHNFKQIDYEVVIA